MKSGRLQNRRQKHEVSLNDDIQSITVVQSKEHGKKASISDEIAKINYSNQYKKNNSIKNLIPEEDLDEIISYDEEGLNTNEPLNAREERNRQKVMLEDYNENNESSNKTFIPTNGMINIQNQNNTSAFTMAKQDFTNLNNEDLGDIDAICLFDESSFNDSLAQNLRALTQSLERNLMETSNDGKVIKKEIDSKNCHDIIVKRLKEDSEIYDSIIKCSKILSEYRSGPVPKILKMISASSLWQPILELTHPEKWTPHATLAMTKLFIAMLPERPASVFLADILMPRIHLELVRKPSKNEQGKRISNNTKPGKLPVQLFEALGKATWRPIAFFKGVVFPLIDENANSTIIKCVTSVLKRWSVPSKYSAPAISKIARAVTQIADDEDFEWSQNGCAFIGSLLDKGYSLPGTTLDDCINYFYKIAYRSPRSQSLPLVYHYSMLIFVKRYASALKGEQQVKLLDITKRQKHEGGITDEIMRVIKESGQQESGYLLDRVAI